MQLTVACREALTAAFVCCLPVSKWGRETDLYESE